MLQADDLDSLRDEVRLLRQVLDEIREELSWANNNAPDLPHSTGALSAYDRITSMSADPAARDFQVNAVDPATVAMLREQAVEEASSRASTQRSLF